MTDALNSMSGMSGQANGGLRHPGEPTIIPAIQKAVDKIANWRAPTRASELAEEMGLFAGTAGSMSAANMSALTKQFQGISAAQRNRVMDAIQGDVVSTNQMARDMRAGGKLEVELTTKGINLTVKDQDGRITSRAFKPYQAQMEE